MKKKIIQWLIGLYFAFRGAYIILFLFCAVESFIKMTDATGMTSVGYFILFIIYLLVFLYLPYYNFYCIKKGISDKWK